ncbi:MAG: glycosyltransferase 61 family protein [Methylovulum sp.]
MMNVVEKNNALIVPQSLNKDFGAGPENFSHGVVRSDGDPLYFSHMRDNKPLLNESLQAAYLKQKPKKLNGKWLYLGGLHNHFGHFLSESIHRTWAWSRYRDECKGVLFLPIIDQFKLNNHFPHYSKEVLSFFGLEKHNITYITELTEVSTLIVPEPGSQLLVPASDEYIQFLSTLELHKHLANIKTPEAFSPKVFVSRKNYRMKGSVAGLDAFANLLKKEGYFIFCPEKYRLSVQLKVYAEAEKIIFEEGSAVHLLELFDKIKADVLLIKRRPTTRSIDCVFQPRTTRYVTYDNTMILPPLSSRKFADMNALSVINLEKLSQFLVAEGFVSPSFTMDSNWIDETKSDIINYFFKQASQPSCGFNERMTYLNSVNHFFKSIDQQKNKN